MLDFVPNHSAVDAEWVIKHPSYYVRAPNSTSYDPSRYTSKGIAYGSAGWWGGSWMDTCQFNYWDMQFKKEQISNFLQVASVSDYIRCDMAYLCLNDQIQSNWQTQLSSWGYKRPNTEFWSDAITLAKSKFPNLKLLAEVYDPWAGPLQTLGFDFTYDKHFYDLLGNGNLGAIQNYISNVDFSYLSKTAHFTENHDEPRAAAFFGSNLRADAATMVAMTIPGMRFYNEGQENGFKNRLQIQLRRSLAEPIIPGVPSFYDKLISILSRPVFHTGEWNFLNVERSDSSWRLLSWKWTSETERILVVVNYSDQVGSGSVILSDAYPINGNDTIIVNELISNQIWYRSANTLKNQGIFCIIQPWSLQVMKYF